MKIILLNGPPRAGKDSIGAALAQALFGKCSLNKFAAPIVEFMKREFGITPDTVDKDRPHPMLLGRTPRDVMIAYSERFCIPLWGHDFFGRSAAIRLANDPDPKSVVVFTDSGFVREAEPLVLKFGASNILQVRVHRPGHTFQNDSRSFWHHKEIGDLEFDNNCNSLPELIDKVRVDLLPEINKWIGFLA